MNIKQISTSSCTTDYEVDGIGVLLWIITGGQPCLSFNDYSFSQRYPITDRKWAISQEKWKKNNCYPHQIGQKPIQGPTYDVLPKGIGSLKEYLDKYLPLKKLKEERYKNLPIKGVISSKGIKDKEHKTIVNFTIDITGYIGPLVAVSKCYAGRCNDVINRLAPKEFKRYNDFINPMFDKSFDLSLEGLTEDEYKELCLILEDIKNSLKR